MPKVDFANVDDAQDFTPVPEGEYLCELAHVDEQNTQYGDEMWRLRWKIIDGEHAGRYIFDNLIFSDAAMSRVKLVCKRLGLDVSGEADLTPDKLMDKPVFITVTIVQYTDNEGKVKDRNNVPFAGYKAAEGHIPTERTEEEEIPF